MGFFTVSTTIESWEMHRGMTGGNEGCAGEDRSCPVLAGWLHIMLFRSAKLKCVARYFI